MKADYYRYLAEVKYEGSSREKDVEEAQKAYENAYSLSKSQLPPINPIHLGIALNYSVFHYEILNKRENACELASTAFDLAIKSHDMDDSNPIDDSHRDAMLILQLLRDNLTLWNSEGETDEPDVSFGNVGR